MYIDMFSCLCYFDFMKKEDLILEKLNNITQQLTDVKQDIAGVKKDVGGLKQDMLSLRDDLRNLRQEINQRFDAMEKRMFRVETDIKEIKENQERDSFRIHTLMEDVVTKDQLQKFAEENTLNFAI